MSIFSNLFRRKQKNVGILTYHCADNAGAQVQAFAMQQFLSQYFHEPIMVDYQNSYRRRNLVQQDDEPDVLQFKQFIEKFHKTDLFPDEQKASEWINKHCSSLFIGSDEVWRLFPKANEIARPSLYFGNGIEVPRIGYAVTMSGSALGATESYQLEQVAKEVEQFAFIACRDPQTVEFVKRYSSFPEENITLVPDPTFSIDLPLLSKQQVQNKIATLGIDLQKPLLLLMLTRRDHIEEERIARLHKKGYQVVSTLNQVGAISLESLRLNPFEWFSLPKAFDFVITQRMHGLIACLLANTPVMSDDGRFKSQNLIKDFNLPSGYTEKVVAEWDYDFVEQKKKEYKTMHQDAIKNIQRILT